MKEGSKMEAPDSNTAPDIFAFHCKNQIVSMLLGRGEKGQVNQHLGLFGSLAGQF